MSAPNEDAGGERMSPEPAESEVDSSLLGRLAVAADRARYEWHCLRHDGKFYECNRPECQESIRLYAEYCAEREAARSSATQSDDNEERDEYVPEPDEDIIDWFERPPTSSERRKFGWF